MEAHIDGAIWEIELTSILMNITVKWEIELKSILMNITVEWETVLKSILMNILIKRLENGMETRHK